MLVDSHVHLDSYSDNEVNQILDRARKVGVGFVISAGTTIASTKRSIYLSSLYDDFFSGVGIHPMDIKEKPNTSEEEVELLSKFMNYYQDEADRFTGKIS